MFPAWPDRDDPLDSLHRPDGRVALHLRFFPNCRQVFPVAWLVRETVGEDRSRPDACSARTPLVRLAR